MSKNIRTQTGKIIGKTLNTYHSKLKPKLDDLKFKEQYQGRIIDCMVGEVDDNYIETPETNSAIVKLEHSKEGLVKVPSIKGKTILIDAEGNETDTPAEGCRLVSVGENENNKLIILSKSKNLFDVNKIDTLSKCKILNKNNENGEVTISYNGNYVNFGINLTEYIDVLIGKTFRASYSEVINTNSNAKLSIQLNGRYKDGTNFYLYPSTTPITITDNMETLTFAIFSNNTEQELQGTFTIKKVQLEIGELTTSFVPCNQHKTEILLNEPLRSLPNGICDEIVDNKLIRRVGKVTLTGEEGWWSNWTNASFFEWFSNLRITNWKPISDNITWCSNKLKSTTSYSIEHQGQFNCFCFGVDWDATNPKVIVRPSYDIVEEGNVDQFKEWLKKNNMIILYELAEPIIEELPNSITLQGFDDTTMYIENSITPTISYGYNALIPYKEELKTQKEEVETNTLDIENNIIPYLMDMEYNLMLMEDN